MLLQAQSTFLEIVIGNVIPVEDERDSRKAKFNLAFRPTCQNFDCRDRHSRQFHIALVWAHIFRLDVGLPLVS